VDSDSGWLCVELAVVAEPDDFGHPSNWVAACAQHAAQLADGMATWRSTAAPAA
jgi:hypothetical protein